MAAGDFLAAYDLALADLANNADDTSLQHLATLALARAGNVDQALVQFRRYRLLAKAQQSIKAETSDRMVSAKLQEDIFGLRARLAKDVAYILPPPDRPDALLRAARLYMAGYQRTDGWYTGINAATLYCLAGQHDMCSNIIKKLIPALEDDLALARASHLNAEGQNTSLQQELYYILASLAEAHLLRGEIDTATAMIAEAAEFGINLRDARSATFKQVARICAATDRDTQWLEVIRPPAVLHYAGHMFPDTGDYSLTDAMITEIKNHTKTLVKHHQIGTAFGALAAGADILFAETLVDLGVTLTVVIPDPADQFIADSVSLYGESWERRLNALMNRDIGHVRISEAPDLQDGLVHRHISDVAIGLALRQAKSLSSHAHQILLWDCEDPKHPAGTARDCTVWQDQGHTSHVIAYPNARRTHADQYKAMGRIPPKPKNCPGDRIRMAMLFADIKGFTKVSEQHMPQFFSEVLTPLAQMTNALDEPPIMQKTWGDGVFMGFASPLAAAEASIQIRDWFLSDVLRDLPFSVNIRIALHWAPCWKVVDPLSGSTDIIGREVSRAARIEPETLPGYIYVTDAFAAGLALAGGDDFQTVYVGRRDLRGIDDANPLYSLQKVPTNTPRLYTRLLDQISDTLTATPATPTP